MQPYQHNLCNVDELDLCATALIQKCTVVIQHYAQNVCKSKKTNQTKEKQYYGSAAAAGMVNRRRKAKVMQELLPTAGTYTAFTTAAPSWAH